MEEKDDLITYDKLIKDRYMVMKDLSEYQDQVDGGNNKKYEEIKIGTIFKVGSAGSIYSTHDKMFELLNFRNKKINNLEFEQRKDIFTITAIHINSAGRKMYKCLSLDSNIEILADNGFIGEIIGDVNNDAFMDLLDKSEGLRKAMFDLAELIATRINKKEEQ